MSVVNVNRNMPMFRANGTNGNMRGRSYAYFIYGQNANKLVTNQYYNYEGNKIHEYKTSKPLTLLDMSDIETINYLKSIGNGSVNKSIDKSFRIRNGEVIRVSKLKHDLAVSRLICTLQGIDGYYAPPLRQKYGDKRFHQEIMLCVPDQKVTFISSKISSDKPLKPPAKRSFNDSTTKRMNYNSYQSP